MNPGTPWSASRLFGILRARCIMHGCETISRPTPDEFPKDLMKAAECPLAHVEPRRRAADGLLLRTLAMVQ